MKIDKFEDNEARNFSAPFMNKQKKLSVNYQVLLNNIIIQL